MSDIDQEDVNKITEKIQEIFQTDIDVSTYEGNTVPMKDDLNENENLTFDCAILFVDIRDSTKLSDESMPNSMAKIYKAFVRAMIMSINICGGSVRQIVGDRVMGVFITDEDETAVKKAYHASRTIISIVEYVFNPICKKHVNNKTIECGVGIDYGKVLLTKVGLSSIREDATELVWSGRRANTASKYTDLAEAGEIFVTKRYYEKLPIEMIKDPEGNHYWKEVVRLKGNSIFEGYCAKQFYLDLILDGVDEKSFTATNGLNTNAIEIDSINQSDLVTGIITETKRQTQLLLQRFESIISRENDVDEQDRKVTIREQQIVKRENELNKIKDDLEKAIELKKKKVEYEVKIDHFRNVIETLKIENAIEKMRELYSLGEKINLSKYEIQAEMYYWQIVRYFETKQTDIAYRLIIDQLTNKHPWINLPHEDSVIRIITNSEKKEEYYQAVKYHVQHFNPNTENLFKLINILKKIGISPQKISDNITRSLQ